MKAVKIWEKDNARQVCYRDGKKWASLWSVRAGCRNMGEITLRYLDATNPQEFVFQSSMPCTDTIGDENEYISAIWEKHLANKI